MSGGNVSRNVSQDVSRMFLEEIENIIKDMIKEDNKVSRKDIAMILGVSEKTITRYIKEILILNMLVKGKMVIGNLMIKSKLIISKKCSV